MATVHKDSNIISTLTYHKDFKPAETIGNIYPKIVLLEPKRYGATLYIESCEDRSSDSLKYRHDRPNRTPATKGFHNLGFASEPQSLGKWTSFFLADHITSEMQELD